MKKTYVEPCMMIETFDDLISTGRPPDLNAPSGNIGGVGGNGIIFEDEEY